MLRYNDIVYQIGTIRGALNHVEGFIEECIPRYNIEAEPSGVTIDWVIKYYYRWNLGRLCDAQREFGWGIRWFNSSFDVHGINGLINANNVEEAKRILDDFLESARQGDFNDAVYIWF